ncbi:MAG: OsmC family protein [Rhizomicrobium sp.]|jgi:organic hydroperoxide reductase OsmC/OhrA
MAEHRARLRWRRTTADFQYATYNRAHEILFKDGTIVLPASSAPAFRGDAERVDPEEAYVASLSSCHMLTFLAICARKGLIVDSYDDDAAGVLEKAANGRLWLATVRLRPLVRFEPSVGVSTDALGDLHHQSHEECFIANSVKTTVTIEPRL